MSVPAGRRLRAYEVVAARAAGGMGAVDRAEETRRERSFGGSVLSSDLAASSDLKACVPRTISPLNHPQSLAGRRRKGPLPFAPALKIVIEIADRLAPAHAAGIIDRDLQPANIMLAKSGAKLLDFGLVWPALRAARAGCDFGEDGIDLTRTSPIPPVSCAGSFIGTVPYMAPEQIEGKQRDARRLAGATCDRGHGSRSVAGWMLAARGRERRRSSLAMPRASHRARCEGA